MADEVQERLSANESVFREINESIQRGHWPGEEDVLVGFRCECARLGCNELLELSVSVYEGVRSHPRQFLVVPGHERLEVEKVVQRTPSYLVVEKIDQAGEKAEETDPRSRADPPD
jgi:hypothetical protein